jgi:hypothetical protein
MKDTRLDVAADEIDMCFQCVKDTREGVPAHFVANIDEMRHQTWTNGLQSTCFVPNACAAKTVHCPVSRQGKLVTVIADGSFLHPNRGQSDHEQPNM